MGHTQPCSVCWKSQKYRRDHVLLKEMEFCSNFSSFLLNVTVFPGPWWHSAPRVLLSFLSAVKEVPLSLSFVALARLGVWLAELWDGDHGVNGQESQKWHGVVSGDK